MTGKSPRSVIVRCVEEGTSSPPKSIHETGIDRVLNRPILSWCDHCGTYGMGGPGFFGLELASNSVHHSEFLVLTLWGADEWLRLNGRWLAAHPKYYRMCRPMFSSLPPTFGVYEKWDEVTPCLLGSSITQFNLNDYSCEMRLIQGSVVHVLELPENKKVLPPHGSGEIRQWPDNEKVADAWVVSSETLHCID